jgi:hypothetical protein
MMKIYGVRYELNDGVGGQGTWVDDNIYQSHEAAHRTAADNAAKMATELNIDNGRTTPYYTEVINGGMFYGVFHEGNLLAGYRVVEFNLIGGVTA